MRSRHRAMLGMAIAIGLSALTACTGPGVQATPEIAHEQRGEATTAMQEALVALTGDASHTTITDTCRLDGDAALGGAQVPRDYRCFLQGVAVGAPVPIEETENRLSALNAVLADMSCSSSEPLAALSTTASYACAGWRGATLEASADLTSSTALRATLSDAQADTGGTVVSRGPRITVDDDDSAEMTFVISLASDYFTTRVCDELTLCP